MHNTDPGLSDTTLMEVKDLMLADYERVIFYLLDKLRVNVDEINVNIMQGNEHHSFQVRKPEDSFGAVHIASIEYTTVV